jgi:hypothetical protein
MQHVFQTTAAAKPRGEYVQNFQTGNITTIGTNPSCLSAKDSYSSLVPVVRHLQAFASVKQGPPSRAGRDTKVIIYSRRHNPTNGAGPWAKVSQPLFIDVDPGGQTCACALRLGSRVFRNRLDQPWSHVCCRTKSGN